MLYVFGDFALDTQRCELHRADNLIKLEPLVFHVLAYLIQHRDRVVPKREILEQLWPQQFVSDWALTRCITEIRRALGCSGRRPQFVKTLYGNGYRFIAAVTEPLPALPLSATPRDHDALHTPTRDGAEQAETALSLLPPRCDQDDLQLDAEPRQGTVLCGHLANTTALAETLGPAAMHSLRHRLFDLALRHVQRYAGTIQHFTETGFMALFGIPLTHEDHARRALLAAVELHRGLRELSADHMLGLETARALPSQLQVCLGLHTGLIMVWRHRSRPETIHASMGDTTYLATHLARHAEPGTMLSSEATAQRVQGEAVLGTVCAVPRAGESHAVLAYKILGMRAQSVSGVSPGTRSLSQFVGREQELGYLHRLLSQVESGRGQVVGIIGAPGMGKSRLLYEFWRSLSGRQVTYLEGHCRSYGSAIPSLPVLDLIRNYCGITEADHSETIIEKVRHSLTQVGIDPAENAPYLLQFLEVPADTAWLPGRSPEATRARTFALLRQMLLKRGQQQPLILALEDLHWIDRASEEVYATLVESFASVPIFLLVTYRAGYYPPWFMKSYTSQVSLQSLSPQDSLMVVYSRRSAAQFPEPVLQDLVVRAEGNPFFLEELTRVVEQSAAQAPVPVPDTIEDVLRARLDQLPEAARALLQTAAVVGWRGSLRLLKAMWQGSGALEPALLELQRLEFLSAQHEDPEPAYVFTHALTQEVAYASLAPARQQAQHAVAGQALETLYAPHLEAVYDRLAYHYARTNEAAKAVEYLTRFAAQATRRYVYTEAVLALQQALEHAERLPATQRDRRCLEVVLHLAQVQSFLGRFAESLDLLRLQHECLERLQEPSLASAYYFRLGRTYSLLGDQAQATQHTQRSLAAATQCGDSVAMGKAYYDLAREFFLSGPLRQGLAYGQRAIALLKHAAGEEWWLGLTYWVVGSLHGLLGDFAAALTATALAQAIGAALDDLHVQSYAASATGWIEAMRGEGSAGIAACQQSLAWALDPVNLALAKGTLGYAYLEQGEASQAIPLLEQSAQQWGAFGQRAMHGWMLTYLAEAYLATGYLAAAQDLARQGVAITSEARCLFALGCAQRVLGRIAQASGSLADAATHLTEALYTFAALEVRFEAGRTHLDLAAVAHAQGHRPTTAAHLVQAQAVFQTLQAPTYVERAAHRAWAYGVPGTMGRWRQRSG